MKVNKENMQTFVAALRSGDYTQTTGRLARGEGETPSMHCCLGVACVVSGVTDHRRSDGEHLFDDEDAVLPLQVRRWLGITSENPHLMGSDGYTRPAAAMNDSGYTFDDIADAFERTFLS